MLKTCLFSPKFNTITLYSGDSHIHANMKYSLFLNTDAYTL